MSHTVDIRAAGCWTTRECDCLITSGRRHSEFDSPWSDDVPKDHKVMSPPTIPYEDGEDHEDYMERVSHAIAWQAGQDSNPDTVNPYL